MKKINWTSIFKEFEDTADKVPIGLRITRLKDGILNRINLLILKQNMKKDPMLNQRLTEPTENNPYYRFLAREIASFLKRKSLLYIIERAIKESDFTAYFCKDGTKITAFVVYIDNGSTIEHVTIFSLLDQTQPNPGLVKDFVKFLHKKFKTYSIITWGALKKDPVVPQYNKAAEMFGLKINQETFEELKHPEWEDLFLYTLKREYYTPKLQEFVKKYLASR